MTAYGVIYAFVAVALFFLPDTLWPNYGLQIDDEYARFLSQHNSIFLDRIAILSILFSDAVQGSEIAVKILTGLLCTNVLGVAITLYTCLTGAFSAFGWSDQFFFALLAILSYAKIQRNR